MLPGMSKKPPTLSTVSGSVDDLVVVVVVVVVIVVVVVVAYNGLVFVYLTLQLQPFV